MNILVDENCLWLARTPALTVLQAAGHTVKAVGQTGTPPRRTPDHEIAGWLRENDYAVMTNDFDDFFKISTDIVIFGLVSKGVFTARADIIVQCLANCAGSFAPARIPSGLYVLTNYHW